MTLGLKGKWTVVSVSLDIETKIELRRYHLLEAQLEASLGISSTGVTCFTTLAGEPMATDQSGMSRVTTEDAPIVHPTNSSASVLSDS